MGLKNTLTTFAGINILPPKYKPTLFSLNYISSLDHCEAQPLKNAGRALPGKEERRALLGPSSHNNPGSSAGGTHQQELPQEQWLSSFKASRPHQAL